MEIAVNATDRRIKVDSNKIDELRTSNMKKLLVVTETRPGASLT
jgi:hypothetical protein